jgi:ABC-2 type transport system ATP-binding protein
MIEARALTKRYGHRTAVDAIDFTVLPGRVTGFLGPNGAGKSTTMRMIVGLDRPTAGSVHVNGRPYHEHRAPLREVGVLVDAKAAHGGRSAYKHLLSIAATHGLGATRVREVIGLAGLDSVAGTRVGGFSLGMGQRLGIATALLGDPATVILDEPVNGLDPEGVRWVRTLMRGLAAEGRTVLLSSHLMSEMAQTADRLIVIGRGRILADGPIADIIAGSTRSVTRVRTRDAERLTATLAGPGVVVAVLPDGALEISGLTAEEVALAAAAAGVVLHEVAAVSGSLEEAYIALTAGEVEYRSAGATGTGTTGTGGMGTGSTGTTTAGSGAHR